MDEVVSCRVTREEKRLAQALAERRSQFVAELMRELLVGELNRNFAAPEWSKERSGSSPRNLN